MWEKIGKHFIIEMYAGRRVHLETGLSMENINRVYSREVPNSFSQSEFPVLNQLDAYHVAQALVRTFRGGKSEI
ncbi:hypothetical protein BpJC7_04020 [Weizmannia acidilactici]|uniref:Uncharacterized protein n=1 Tax=Weizmannia acidilactici TaxID=2607726 RepID=A0A5J4JCW4_9BACI|nr:hypothetical protein BpJC7_04020 [Weizmannia acidilactici]